jgi:hypothetical protein
MKEDDLKRFIQDNQEEFDSLEPSAGLWDRIDEGLPRATKMIPLKRAVMYVAAASLVVAVSAITYFSSGPENLAEVENPQEVSTEELDFAPLALSQVSAEMAEVENYYIAEVNSRLEELGEFEVDQELWGEVEFLKAEFEQLKTEMGQGADKQRIIEAMIENYRLRLELLEDILNELKEERDGRNSTTMA